MLLRRMCVVAVAAAALAWCSAWACAAAKRCGAVAARYEAALRGGERRLCSCGGGAWRYAAISGGVGVTTAAICRPLLVIISACVVAASKQRGGAKRLEAAWRAVALR